MPTNDIAGFTVQRTLIIVSGLGVDLRDLKDDEYVCAPARRRK